MHFQKGHQDRGNLQPTRLPQVDWYVDQIKSIIQVRSYFIGCETPLANQIFKRLETEGKHGFWFNHSRRRMRFPVTGFIMKLSPGDPGSHVTRSKAKTKAGKARQRKNLKKEYVFSRSSKQSQQYLDYFNPTMDAEMALIGFDNLVGIPLYLPGPRFFLAVNLQDVKTRLHVRYEF